MRFRFIREHRETFQVGRMCRVLRVSRSGFYAWLKRPICRRKIEDSRLAQRIASIHKRSRKTYGSPRVHAALLAEGEHCGRKRVARLMREHRIRSVVQRRYRVSRTTVDGLPAAPNVLNREFRIDDINKVWVADITYIPTDQGFLYLASIMDLCSRAIVGWSMASSPKKQLVIDAMEMALGRRSVQPGLIHHSDRGNQYASGQYQRLLRSRGIIPSMSRRANCYDNAVKESFFHSLKTELVRQTKFKTRDQARRAIFDYIESFYNRERLHSSIGYRAPALFEAQLGSVV